MLFDVDYLLWIPLMPLLGALVIGTVGKRLGRDLVNLIACATILWSFLLSVGTLLKIWDGTRLALVGSWFHAGNFAISSGLQVDHLSGLLLLIVTGIGFLIHVYSTAYMADDPAYWRYFAYLNLFVGAMLILILADNLVLLFVGWEGVGLCSYLLIGFWYDDEAKASAGKKAFIVNRVGDFGFGLAVFATIALFGGVGFNEIQGVLSGAHPADVLRVGLFAGWQLQSALTLIALLFVLGVTGKSAQIPLYIWLPDAMAGPTPVSALIHAATMVTAGVYLMCRLAILFAFSPVAMLVVACLGAGTALFAALIAFAQNDIKKVLAYSTISQLGFMVLAVGVGAFWAAIFHLITHACFKALLFLGSGSVIHGMHGEQDMRRMGGLRHKLPHTAAAFAVATVAITGVLPFSGFFSKDAILGLTLGTANNAFPWAPPVLYAAGTAAALGTAFYMWRLWALTFEGGPRSETAEHAHEFPLAMTLVDDVLALLAVVTLALGLPFAAGAPLQNFLEPVFGPALRALPALVPPKEEGIPWATYGIALAVAWVGAGLARWMYLGGGQELPAKFAASFPFGARALENKFYVDELYQAVIVRPLWSAARTTWRLIDVGLIDTVCVRGSAAVVRVVSVYVLRPLQNGDTQRYAAAMALGVATLLWLVLR